MKPYYEEAGITIWHGDCRQFPWTHISLDTAIVSDPPYGMNNNADYSRFSGGNTRRGPGTKHENIVGDQEPFNPGHLFGYKKLILWGANHYWNHLSPGGSLVWVKRNEDAYGTFLSDAEIAYVSGIQGVYCFRQIFAGSAKAIDAGYNAYQPSAHPNQKPVDLMQWCLSFTHKDSPICDPYMGSGTTLIAAKNLGRTAVGIELEERYCEIAANRLRQSVLNFEGVA